MVTQRTSSDRGAIAEFACAKAVGAGNEAACVDGSMADPPLSGWKVFAGLYPGGIALLAVLPNGSVIIDDDGHQMPFNLSTGIYTKGP